jgi:hypothetical protein
MSNELITALQSAAGNVSGDFYPYTVDNSARFDVSSYLYRTAGTATDARKGAISFWAKRGKLTASQVPFVSFGSPSTSYIELTVTDTFTFQDGGNSALLMTYLRRQFRDTSAWYHFLLILDSTNPVANDRDKLYINGVRETDFASGRQGNTTLNGIYQALSAGNANGLSIGYSSGGYDGYLAEVALVDGTVYSETDFGEFKNGVWTPKDISGLTFGNNGFYLDFGNSAALGTDVSGNGNNFTTSGLTSSDQMIDTPTNNFATYNPLQNKTGLSHSDGNLIQDAATVGGSYPIGISTQSMPSGSWYAEFRYTGTISAGAGIFVPSTETLGYSFIDRVIYSVNGQKSVGGTPNISYGATYASGDIIGCHYDADTGDVEFYKNGVSQGVAATVDTEQMWVFGTQGYTTGNGAWRANFGQNGTFNGTVTAGGNTDANGLGDFKYTVPTDALALCTANLPEPTIGPNSTIKPDEVFAPILYTGNGTSQSISTLEFQPDFTWIKNRDAADNHMLFDAVRGATNYLNSNLETSGSSGTDAQSLSSFDSNGFSVGNNVAVNTNAEDYVAWNWKVGGSGVSNTDGSISATVSVNTDAGISLSRGNVGTSGNVTIGHGLGVAPDFVVGKPIGAGAWSALVPSVMTKDDYFFLNRTDAVATYTDLWGSALPTSSVIGLQAGIAFSNDTLFYSFVSKEGFSSIGSYTGNGSADGPFIYTGFRPAFVVIKATDIAYSWNIYDSERGQYNTNDYVLLANLPDAEIVLSDMIDFLSNGFKLRSSALARNGSGNNYIYMAFAENPFKYSNAR